MEKDGYSLLLPFGVTDYFNVLDVKESSDELTIYLEEKNVIPEEYSSLKVHSKGFYEPIVLQDFPLRGRKVFLNIRRRRWYLVDQGEYVHRDWSLVANGTRMTQEFASFLKELHR